MATQTLNISLGSETAIQFVFDDITMKFISFTVNNPSGRDIVFEFQSPRKFSYRILKKTNLNFSFPVAQRINWDWQTFIDEMGTRTDIGGIEYYFTFGN